VTPFISLFPARNLGGKLSHGELTIIGLVSTQMQPSAELSGRNTFREYNDIQQTTKSCVLETIVYMNKSEEFTRN